MTEVKEVAMQPTKGAAGDKNWKALRVGTVGPFIRYKLRQTLFLNALADSMLISEFGVFFFPYVLNTTLAHLIEAIETNKQEYLRFHAFYLLFIQCKKLSSYCGVHSMLSCNIGVRVLLGRSPMTSRVSVLVLIIHGQKHNARQ